MRRCKKLDGRGASKHKKFLGGALLMTLLAMVGTASANAEGLPYQDVVLPEDPNYVSSCPWKSSTVNYAFDNGTEDIVGNAEHQTSAEGMAIWSTVSAVDFVSSEKANILFRWRSGDHGDGYPFDGAGGILAHAFFPCAPKYAGEIHFDDGETWTTSERIGWSQPLDLFTVAAHEAGHAIGLAHSSDESSLMAPTYTGSHRYLTWDDIAGVQSLYKHDTGLYHLRNSNTEGRPESNFRYQQTVDKPVVGDWDGDGDDTIGIYRPSELKFYLRNSNTEGSADISPFIYGSKEYLPLAGDWDGDGDDTIGMYRPFNSSFGLRNTNSEGKADIDIQYGSKGDIPVVGDWDGDGDDTIGVYRPSDLKFYLRNKNTEGAPEITPFVYGSKEYLPFSGDWDKDGDSSIGMYRPYNSTFGLRYLNSEGKADIDIAFGSVGGTPVEKAIPVVGDWDGDGRDTVGLFQN